MGGSSRMCVPAIILVGLFPRRTVLSRRRCQLPPLPAPDVLLQARCTLPNAAFCLLALTLAQPRRASAQGVRYAPVASLGGEAEDRMRVAELLGVSTTDAVMLRSSSRLQALAQDSSGRLRVLLPELRTAYNSALPFSQNDGPLRAGRGISVLVTGGAQLRLGALTLVVEPQVVYEENRFFQVINYPPGALPSRSIWANPFHPPPQSIDLPLRFGDASRLQVDPGQSSLTLRLGRTEAGVATENLWWGPGIRNAIVLSNNAPGFPHALLRSAEPVPTRIGQIGYDLVAGVLDESEYFDGNGNAGRRLGTGGAVTWRRTGSSGLRLGLSRFWIVGHSGHDQISSAFGRWVFPTAGFEAYVEWARFQDPRGFRDFLEFPTHSQGYTYGLQWARPLAPHRTFRLQAELTNLEPSPSFRLRPVATSYTSAVVPQGFTERGQMLGAAIGPGSSSQWLAGDLLGSSWRLGAFLGRIRNDNGTLFSAIVPELKAQDVTVYGGVRGAHDVPGGHVSLELGDAARLNYLYQGGVIRDRALGGFRGVDVANRTLSLIFSTVPGKR